MAFVLADRVKETSTSTGTGAFTLAGAMTGFVKFSDRCVVGDRCYYCIQAVDGAGAPSGEWEVGSGIYSATNTLTRTFLLGGSNGALAVSFSAGTKQVFITLLAEQFKYGGEALDYLEQTRDYYVRKDGSDSNDGLSDTAGGAFLTIAKAMSVVSGIEFGYVYIYIRDGTYNEYVSFPSDKPNRGIIVIGNTVTPSNVVINHSSGVSMGRSNTLLSVKITGVTANAINIRGGYGLNDTTLGDIVFGTVTGSAIKADEDARVYLSGGMTITASMRAFMTTAGQSRVLMEIYALTFSGTPAFSAGFIEMSQMSLVNIPSGYLETITGAATGKRYDIRHNSILLNASAVTLPGGTAGATATGGQYTTT